MITSCFTTGDYPLERFWETAQRLYEKYGPVVKVARYSGKNDMVMVYRPEDTKKIFQVRGIEKGETVLGRYDFSLQWSIYRKNGDSFFVCASLYLCWWGVY